MKGLKEHLQKAEIEYIAAHGGGYPVTFTWDPEIEAHIERLGFNVKRRFTADDEFLVTTSGIVICLADGYICSKNKSDRK